VNKKTYIDTIRRFRNEFSRKCQAKWRTKCRFLPHNNALAHRSVLVKDFLEKKNVTTMEIPQYSSGLFTADMYLLPRMTTTMKERSFCDATDIIKNEECERRTEKVLTK
jgi:hypothetical protein